MKEALLEAASRAAHETGRAFSMARGASGVPHWEQVPEDERRIVRKSARRVAEGCSARELHAAWGHDSVEAGWRYGSERNVIARQDPELAPWESLPPVGRARWELFASSVRAMLLAFPVSHLVDPGRARESPERGRKRP